MHFQILCKFLYIPQQKSSDTCSFLSITCICEIVLELLMLHHIFDGASRRSGAKRRAYATRTPTIRQTTIIRQTPIIGQKSVIRQKSIIRQTPIIRLKSCIIQRSKIFNPHGNSTEKPNPHPGANPTPELLL